MNYIADSAWTVMVSSEIDANYIVELHNGSSGLDGKRAEGKETVYLGLVPRFIILLRVRIISPIQPLP